MPKLDVDAIVGVPDSTPPVDNDMPVGTLPPLTVKAYGGTPPEAVTPCEYGTPTVPPGSAPRIEIGWHAPVPDSVTVREPPFVLEIVTRPLFGPDDVGWKLTDTCAVAVGASVVAVGRPALKLAASVPV